MRFVTGLIAVLIVFTASVAAQELDYAAARAKARGKLPLLIFVNTPSRHVEGFVSCRVDTLPGYPTKCIVLGDSKLDWLATFDPRAVDHDFRKAVMPTQVPFVSGPASNVGRDDKLTASVDALDEVNAVRARRGLRPYVRDDGLTKAAFAVATYRAQNGIRGHVPRPSSDFAFLTFGSDASAAGCGALEASWGFQSCCMYERWTHAGAAWVMGSDNLRYCHLFVR